MEDISNEYFIDNKGDMSAGECLEVFQGAKRIFNIVNYFDMEIQNGGLCQTTY